MFVFMTIELNIFTSHVSHGDSFETGTKELDNGLKKLPRIDLGLHCKANEKNNPEKAISHVWVNTLKKYPYLGVKCV